MQQHRKICSGINGAQDVKLKSASIKLMNKYKQIAAPFKICVDTEYNLEKKIILLIETKLKNIKIIFLVVLLMKLHVLIINLINKLLFTENKCNL